METKNMPTRSTADKLAAAKALVARLEAQLANETIRTDVREGDDIDFQFGRGKTKRNMSGIVVAVATGTPQGTLLKVQAGTGFDAEIVKINVRDVTVNRTQEQRLAADAPAPTEEAPATEEAPVDASPEAGADPLDAI